jgi:hypothetical protein
MLYLISCIYDIYTITHIHIYTYTHTPLRQCVLVKMQLVREKDKVDRAWNAYKSNGLLDAVNRAEHEGSIHTHIHAYTPTHIHILTH